jgi:hypothetical protein
MNKEIIDSSKHISVRQVFQEGKKKDELSKNQRRIRIIPNASSLIPIVTSTSTGKDKDGR